MMVSKKRRQLLKEFGKRRIRSQRDRLAEGAAPRWRHAFVLASLQACAIRRGWSRDKIGAHIYPMADRIPAIVLCGRV